MIMRFAAALVLFFATVGLPAQQPQPLPPDTAAPPPQMKPAQASPKPALPRSDVAPAAAPVKPPQGSAAPVSALKGARHTKNSPATPAPEPAPVAAHPVTPPAPSTPRDLPPNPPQGSFRNGMLSVTANNSTMLDVLNLARRLTGATFDLPPAGLTERLFVQLGPAPPRDILTQLLDTPTLNYVIVGAEDDASAVARVIVTQRLPETPGGARNFPPPSALRPAEEQAEEQQPQLVPAPQPGTQPGPMGVPSSPLPPRPQFPTVMPGMQPPDQNQNPTPPQPQTDQPQQQQVKTPEQLLEELKRLQKQQQEQQQQQKPPQH